MATSSFNGGLRYDDGKEFGGEESELHMEKMLTCDGCTQLAKVDAGKVDQNPGRHQGNHRVVAFCIRR